MSRLFNVLLALIFIACLALGAFEMYSWGYENGTMNALKHANELMLAASGDKLTCVEVSDFIDGIVSFWQSIGR